MSELLKESIADAKAVRDTALANAKTFLTENFAAEVKQMFNEKLKEEMSVDEMEEATGTKGYGEADAASDVDSSKVGNNDSLTAKSSKPVKPAGRGVSSTDTKVAKQQFDVKLEEEAPPELHTATSAEDDQQTDITSEELEEILAELENGIPDEGGTDDVVGDMGAEGGDDAPPEQVNGDENPSPGGDNVDEISLDELLAQLEAEEAGTAAPAPAPADPNAQVPQVPAAPADPNAPPVPVAPADPNAPPVAPPVPAPGEVPSPSEDNEEVTSEEMAEALISLNEENKSLKQSMAQHIKTIKFMKGVLSETNLLNAKLLYTNKLFKGKSLTEDQKLKIINTLDLTKSIREVKLAYTILAESFNSGASVARKKTNATARSITEGLASKQIASTRPDPTIVEPQVDEMALRFQQLAGIKTKK